LIYNTKKAPGGCPGPGGDTYVFTKVHDVAVNLNRAKLLCFSS
jgi:hypothetical protein